MIEVERLSHRYGPLTAVEDLSFRVARGEVLGLLGPNGAGKTTTMRSIVGLLTPSEGSVRIGGHDMHREPVEARRLLGYLPEAVSLYKELTVREMLATSARIKGVAAGQVASEVDRVVEGCGLEEVFSRLIGFCSRGYRQRIGLAHALIGDPPVLILDEPTVGLDPAQIVEIRNRVTALSRDKAVILSTHILSEASLLCSRVLILSNGRAVAEDTPEHLEQGLGEGTRLRLVCAAPGAGVGQALNSAANVSEWNQLESEASGRVVYRVDLTSPDGVGDLVAILVGAGESVLEIGPERLGLEAVFLRLIRGDDASSTPVKPSSEGLASREQSS